MIHDDENEKPMYDSIDALCEANNWGPEIRAQIIADAILTSYDAESPPPTLH